jgi:hypothetical protein
MARALANWSYLEANVKRFSFLILRKVFSTFDKNTQGIFKCEYKKKLGGFVQMDISFKAD